VGTAGAHGIRGVPGYRPAARAAGRGALQAAGGARAGYTARRGVSPRHAATPLGAATGAAPGRNTRLGAIPTAHYCFLFFSSTIRAPCPPKGGGAPPGY